MKKLLLILPFLFLGCATLSGPTLLYNTSLTLSLGCEAADLATTMYYVGKGSVYEANPILRPYQDNPIRFTAVKGGITAGYSWLMNYYKEEHPTLTSIGLLSNAALKCYIAGRNDNLGRPRMR